MEEMGQSYLNDIKLIELWSQNQLICSSWNNSYFTRFI